ncbi:MAG: acyltransferase [Chitinophagaceae bacterium]|nr:acyltransferase [Chitinophagaceae bacterium]
MKKLLEALIRRRNPQFRFDEAVSSHVLFHFAWQQLLAVLRGSRLWLAGRHPKGMLRGRGVHFFNLPNIRWGRFLKLGDHVAISGLGRGKVQLGHHVSIGAFSRVIISTSLNQVGEGIDIGDNVGIGEYAYLGGGGGLRIGHDCIVGQYLSCHPENHVHDDPEMPIRHQGVTRKGIEIGPNCWIGSKVTILDGVHIGEGCVVAAGSVVTKSFPARAVIGGVPARVLRMRAEATTVPAAAVMA